MPTYAWLTDIHLDSLRSDAELIKFFESVVAKNPEGIIITGDISNSSAFVYHLSAAERVVQRPIHFVLGNHDFWRGNIDDARKAAKELSNMSSFTKHIQLKQFVQLSPTTALIGHDGWYDAGAGDWKKSNFTMNDWYHIGDFARLSRVEGRPFYYGAPLDMQKIVTHSKLLAQESVNHVADSIKSVVRTYKKIIIATHVPPFAQSHVYNGKPGSDAALPWYTNKVLGDMIISAAAAHKDKSFIVLCGHTHGKWSGNVAHNVVVHVGGAEYGAPTVAGLIDVT